MAIETRFKQGTIVFNDWEIVGYIGNGSGGKTAVFQIVRPHEEWQEVSALKVINILQEIGKKSDLAEEYQQEYEAECKELCRQAQEELRLMSCLQGYPNIVEYYDFEFVEYQEENAFGMDLLIRIEFLENMREEQKKKGTYSEAEILRIGKDICRGLQFCHQAGIIHRDIKPANIFVTDRNSYKLGDFGIARMVDAGQKASTKMGTRAYAAPEQFMSYQDKYDERVDIYSLGLTLYELANGNKLPFASSAYVRESEIQLRIMGKEFPAPENASPKLAEVIKKACVHKPEDRYASVEEFGAALHSVDFGATGNSVFEQGAAERKKPSAKDKSGLIGIIILVLVILFFGFVAFGLSRFIWKGLDAASSSQTEEMNAEAAPFDVSEWEDLPSHEAVVEEYGEMLGEVLSVKVVDETIAVITKTGDLYMWGGNTYGQIGCGNQVNQHEPVYIMSDVASVELSGEQSAAVTTKGELYIWGKTSFGQVTSNKDIQLTPSLWLVNVKEVNISKYHGGALCNNGDLYTWGSKLGSGLGKATLVPQVLLTDVVSFSMKSLEKGYENGGAVTRSGELYMWGNNSLGQLGRGESGNSAEPLKIMDDVKSIYMIETSVAAIKNNGDLYLWGFNAGNQIKNKNEGESSFVYEPVFKMGNVESVALAYGDAAAITTDKKLYSWGRPFISGVAGDRATTVLVAEDVKSVFLSDTVNGYITEKGELYLCGENGSKQIQNSDKKRIFRPIHVADNISCVDFAKYDTYAVDEYGRFYQWPQ